MEHPVRALGAALAALATLTVLACGAANSGARASTAAPNVRDALMPAAQESEREPGAADAAGGGQPAAGSTETRSTETAYTPAGSVSARMRVYSGTARLSVDSVEQARGRLVEMAEAAGGYVESIAGDSVTVRVPAASVRDVFARVLLLGSVRDRRIETYDVTEEFQDLAGRLAVARQTRERLYDLLEATRRVDERLAILKEIRRLTEQIEQLALTLETLERLVAYSRITVRLESRVQEDGRAQREIPFAWMAALDPLIPTTGRLRVQARPDLGEGFAVFTRERIFRAESSEGVRVRMGTVVNRPRGDTQFWQQALVWNLGPLYGGAEPVELGRLAGVQLTARGPEPYTYLVVVAAVGARLHVVEVFFPTPDALEARYGAVRSALDGLEVR